MVEIRARHRRPAFSLLELVLVVAIIAVFGAIAAPRYTLSAARYRVDGAASRIVHDIALARARARTRGESQSVDFQTADNSYRIPGLAGPGGESDYSVDLDKGFYEAEIVSAKFGRDARIVFNGHGMPDSGGSVVIRVGSMRRVIVVDPDAGKASVQ
jgi:prepilin-type N-terminal cleavage/methylation domain-containing protein